MIQLIGDTLQKSGCLVFYENGDADLKIAKTAVEESLTKNVTLIGEDTDLLVLLLYYCVEKSDFNLYFRTDKENKKKDNIIRDIYHYRTVLATQLCSDLLFIHAFSGCDTTSSFCGIGKGTLFSMYRNQNDKVIQSACQIFSSNNMSQADIEEAGEKVVLKIYKVKQGEMLNGARQRLLSNKVLKAKTFVKPERLPPTKAALRYHSLRCYYQILEWKNAHHNLKTEDWGWMKVDNKLTPQDNR